MSNGVHIDVPLTNLAVQAFNTNQNYVIDKVFPAVPVAKQSDLYYTLDQASFMIVPRTLRAPKTKSNRIEFQTSSDSYFAHHYTLADGNAIEDLANSDAAIMLRETSTLAVVQGLLRDREVRGYNKIVSNVSSIARYTGANAWDAVNSADIITPVRDAKKYVRGQTGYVPNSIIIDWDSYDYATRNNLAWAKLQYTQAGGQLSLQHLKQLWDVQNIYISDSQKNNANRGATGSYTSVWGASCFVYYAPPVAATLKTAAYGLGMQWRPDGIQAPMTVGRQTFSGPGTENEEVIEAGYFQDEKVVASALGYMINTKSGTPW